MYDIPELEKKWRKYKRNQIKKPIIISIVSVLLIGGISAIVLTYINSSSPKESVSKKTTTVAKSDDKPAMVIVKNSSNPNVKQSSNQQTTSNTQSDNEIDLSKATIVKPNVPDDEIRVIGFDKKEKKEIEKKYSDILLPTNATKDIQEREHIKELEEKFKESQDPNDSLEIAKYYYKKGNYKKAETWAVNTNNIDGDLEDSWLIFAKARFKQGFRIDAIKVLQSFYDETNSQKAKKLLDKIRRGKNVD